MRQLRNGLRSSFVFLMVLASAVLANKDIGKSVVHIKCTTQSGKPAIGTGFAWNQPTHIVTALHVVAGCDGIDVSADGLVGESPATLVKAFKASDLALIELKENIGLVPLKLGEKISYEKRHNIWGYPNSVKKIQGDVLNFSLVRDSQSTLEDVMSKTLYQKNLGQAGYPSFTAPILRVGSPLQPGHSGAPIVDPDYNVVGIGDGGLYEGIRTINWAIPATSVKQLLQSKESTRVERNTAVALHSAPTPSEERKVVAMSDGIALRLVFSTSLKEIEAMSSDEEWGDVEKLFDEKVNVGDVEQGQDHRETDDEPINGEVGNDQDIGDVGQMGADESSWKDWVLDVYEDSISGATIAVPHGMKPTFDAKRQMVVASDKSGQVTLHVRVANKGGQKASQQFDAYFSKAQRWNALPGESEERSEKRDIIQIDKFLMAGDDPQGPSHSLFYSSMVDSKADTFLGTAILAKNLLQLSPDDKKTLRVMEACVELAGFRLD